MDPLLDPIAWWIFTGTSILLQSDCSILLNKFDSQRSTVLQDMGHERSDLLCITERALNWESIPPLTMHYTKHHNCSIELLHFGPKWKMFRISILYIFYNNLQHFLWCFKFGIKFPLLKRWMNFTIFVPRAHFELVLGHIQWSPKIERLLRRNNVTGNFGL